MGYFHSWLDMTKQDRCQIDFIKDSHYMMTSMITPAEKETAEWMSKVPVIKADYMKILALYYLAGIATDFDVQARKVYPEEWYTVKEHTHDCSLLLGLEHDCWDDVCKNKYSFAADGQINNWVLASKEPHSPFLRLYLDRIRKQLIEKGGLSGVDGVQNVAGSGLISKFLREYLPLDYGDMVGVVGGKTLKQDLNEVVKFNVTSETVCLLGQNYLGNTGQFVTHHFEGTWK